MSVSVTNTWTDSKIRGCRLHYNLHISRWFDLYSNTFNLLPDNKILDWSKSKQIADDIFK